VGGTACGRACGRHRSDVWEGVRRAFGEACGERAGTHAKVGGRLETL
jgi:hypothetical protein